ncbi:MAG: HAD family hydrolase [Dehalococcoidia bacterium]|nr:HAD family hydrolase [Dehalococcoidia bacterium]
MAAATAPAFWPLDLVCEMSAASGAVAFVDFDRTLSDADSVMSEILDGVLGLTGLQAVQAFAQAHEVVHERYPERHDDRRLTFQLLLEQHQPPSSAAAVDKVQERYDEAWSSSWRSPRLFPDALPFLRGLRAQGLRLYLATGDHAPQKAAHLLRLAGEPLLLGAFDPEALGHEKGSRGYVLRALELAGSPAPQAVWVVGDSLRNDIEPARQAGLRALWVNRNGAPLRPQDPAPTYAVRDLQEALALICRAPAQRGPERQDWG